MSQFFPTSPWLAFESLRLLSTTPISGAESELISGLSAISPSSSKLPGSWRSTWEAQSTRAEATARRCTDIGNRILAKHAFLRAANYTRASGYLLTGERMDLQHVDALGIAQKAATLFRNGMRLSDGTVRVVKIPVPGTGLELPGYLYLPPVHKRASVLESTPKVDRKEVKVRKIPILINCGGADSTQEELFSQHPAMAMEMGYACLTFDGPGQGIALRKDGLKMRPDWEYVLGYVLDFVVEYGNAEANRALGLDTERIAVSGCALGGYFALRGASDSRVKACVALDPVYDLFDFGTRHVAPAMLSAWANGWIPDGVVDRALSAAARWSFQLHWELSTTGFFLGVETPTKVLREMKKFTLKEPGGDSFLRHVHCPVLVSGARSSLYLDVDMHTGMTWKGLQHLNEEDRELWIAQQPEDGALQAKIGAFALSNEKTFAFLDKRLGVTRERLADTS
ncbi:alpha/beta-hydrolase [Aspergillus venezuelensis]